MQQQLYPCSGSMLRSRTFRAGDLVEDYHSVILDHPPCSCNTGCRRLALWADRPYDASQTTLIIMHAHVGFGDNCDAVRAEVDWRHGAMLDLLGCATTVALHVHSQIIAPGAEDQRITLKALSACCGAGGARGNLTWTSPFQAGAGTFTVEIPYFAYALSGFVGDAPTGIQWVSSGGAAMGAAAAGDTVPEGAVAVQFTLGGGENASIVFLIGL